MAIATLRGTLANGSTQKAELEYKNTYIAIYGSGWLSPTFRGGSHNTGDAFKEVASARHRINREKILMIIVCLNIALLRLNSSM